MTCRTGLAVLMLAAAPLAAQQPQMMGHETQMADHMRQMEQMMAPMMQVMQMNIIQRAPQRSGTLRMQRQWPTKIKKT